MKGLYYHPDRIVDATGALMDSDKHSAIVYFCEQIEENAPEVINELKSLYDCYGEAHEWFEKFHKGSRIFPNSWKVVSTAQDNNYSGYIKIRESIMVWAKKFYLIDPSDFYKEVGLFAISVYYEETQEFDRKKRKRNIEEYARNLNIPIAACRNMYRTSWPYEEVLSLSEYIYHEDEEDDIELSKSIGQGEQIHALFFHHMFPFTFSPDTAILGLNPSSKENAFTFEWIQAYYELILSTYEKRREEAIKAGKP
ncbi:hypothetical protein [Paenibacillus eucommiae]|uniref:Uncharacterized protein n=1 Tax=Paenibacillus eucommiae TaxID=1355755 RepID=A0ABS4JAP9_9BACL|nr:hypothetical protein [Paenibacillus eucommiae]MBP1996922.1 hypothetical protein [Paenibacillus eucommiae]